MGVAQSPRKYVTLSLATIWLPVAAVLSRHDAEASSFFPIFIVFFIFQISGEMHNLFVSALVQYNNTNVRLPEYFFLLEARLGKS